MADLATRVLVVGSGVAGSLVARTLLDKGYSSVTVLDAGPGVLMRDQRNWYDYVTNGNLPYTSLYDLPADYMTSAEAQIRWGLEYIQDTYGTPCSAWSFKQGNGWY